MRDAKSSLASQVEEIVPVMQSYNYALCQSLLADLQLALQQLETLQEGSSTIPAPVMGAIMSLPHEVVLVWDWQKQKEKK